MNHWLVWTVVGLIAYLAFRRRHKYRVPTRAVKTFTVPVNNRELFAKTPLNKPERLMFHRLREALPEYVVLSQVNLASLLTSTDPEVRSRYDRLTATYVVCTQGFGVVAVIEVEDPMNAPRQLTLHDQARLLKKAGYTVIRYKRIPEVDAVRNDFGLAPSEHPAHIVIQRS